MTGYYNQPAETAAAFTADGFMRTGDIAVMQEDGYSRIVDRKKDMILVSGFNVFPERAGERHLACARAWSNARRSAYRTRSRARRSRFSWSARILADRGDRDALLP